MPFVVFVNFHGLNVAATAKLRALTRATSGKYQVAKKTLIRKALESFNVSGAMPDLEGEIGMIFSPAERLMEIAKNLVKFIKEHKELNIAGGILENCFIGSTTVVELSAIPSREVLLARLVYAIKSPVQGLVVALSGIQRSFVGVLNQISAKSGKN